MKISQWKPFIQLIEAYKINIEKKYEVLRQCSSSCIIPCIQEELKGT
jgi:hypothetical protein